MRHWTSTLSEEYQQRLVTDGYSEPGARDGFKKIESSFASLSVGSFDDDEETDNR